MSASLPAVPDTFRRTMAGRPAAATGMPDGDTWLARLPHLVTESLERWDLTLDGPATHGECALVVPVRQGRERAALKISWPHPEARHEHLALKAWRGIGAVRLKAADPGHHALLLERLEPARRLHEMSALDACESIGAVHARLRLPALPQLDTATAWCARIAERLTTSPPELPRRMISEALTLARELPTHPGADSHLVHTDLHDANVMTTTRAGTVDGFVAIDPKPLAGTPALAIAPLLWNRWDEAAAGYNLRNHLRFRVDYACDPLGVDPAHARAWAIVRLADLAWGRSDDARSRRQSPPDLTKEVSIIKAMQG